MTRREFVLAASTALTSHSAPAAPPPRPNVLMIGVDDMNDWVGCLGGYPGVRTPNIDRLARTGVLFSNAHCAAPVCNPSRTALFTGRRPSTTGIYDNEQFWRPALPGLQTLPEYFRANGYYAAGAGKVLHHVAGFNPPEQWDEFQLQIFDDPWYRRAEWYPWVKKEPTPAGYPYNGIKNFPGEFDWGVLPKNEPEYGDMRAVDWAGKFLKRKHEKPFFAAVGLWHPHIPMFAPQKYFDMYEKSRVNLPVTPEDDLADVPPQGQKFAAARREEFERIVKDEKWRDMVQAYLACITFADAMVGQILDFLQTSAYANNTVVVFWSDNGWHLGEKRHVHKSTLWQRSTHVPLIVAGPTTRQSGQGRPQPVSLLDLYPTLLDVCGLPANPLNEGVSLKPLLENRLAPHDPVVTTYWPGNHSVRDERWRYTRYNDGGEELFDEAADKNEFHNLAGNPSYAAIKQRLARYMPATSATPALERTAYDFNYEKYTYRLKER
ncbi:MAG: sulfatase [Acidobacteriota bacterium]|nr:sulfatase [Acidobacteriota bacterium]